MSRPVDTQASVFASIDGTPVDANVMQHLIEATVDQHSHMPHMLLLRFHDPTMKLLDEGPFDLTKKVKIEATHADGSKILLMEGEITGIEPRFEEEKPAEFVVIGYDKSHRLYRELRSVAHLNKKDSDLASEIAQKAELQAQVDVTQTVYDHIYQHNQSDLAFLMQRARRIGYECFVDQGKLYFRKPTTDTGNLKLEYGHDLLSFRPALSLAEQVDEVVVKGWDAEKQAAIIGRSQSGKLYPKIKESKDGAAWAKTFGAGKMIIVDQPVVSQAEADALAAARLDEISGAFIQAEGEAYRRPDVQAGHYVEITNIGKRFSGKYLITRAIHTYAAHGLRTQFWVSGSRTGSLIEALTHRYPNERWSGLVIGIVTNSDDPSGWGRVKIKFPWMSDDAASDWARLVAPGAGPDAGLAFVPAVGDEVVIAFAHGDFSQPYVLGGLWNGKHKLPEATDKTAQGEKSLVRTWQSRTGHSITIYDNADKKIEIKTVDGYMIALDDKNKGIEIKGPGTLKITMTQDITIEGKANITVKAAGDLTLEASKNLTLKGMQVSLEANAKASLKGANVAVEGSAVTEVKGGLVKIN